MNEQEYRQLKNSPQKLPVITVADLANKEPRTLMYGYGFEGNDVHVYLEQDGDIHVLVSKQMSFPPGADKSGPAKYFVVEHTQGPNGAVQSNEGFVPRKRSYPESCDLEFAQLLRLRGIDIAFTAFSVDSSEQRKALHGGWEAQRFDPVTGVAGVEVCAPVLRQRPALIRMPIEVCFGLVIEAVRVLKVPFAQSKQQFERMGVAGEQEFAHIYVADSNASAVEAMALQYFDEMDITVTVDLVAHELVELLFSCGEYESVETMFVGGGEIRVSITYEPGNLFVSKNEQLTHYRGPLFHYCEQAISGVHRGRPFIATIHESTVNVQFSLFGAKEGFVERYVQTYNLRPTGN